MCFVTYLAPYLALYFARCLARCLARCPARCFTPDLATCREFACDIIMKTKTKYCLYNTRDFEGRSEFGKWNCCMDKMLVVLRHAPWSRDRGGLGWKHFVILYKRGAWWNRFSWAKPNWSKAQGGTDEMIQEILMQLYQFARLELGIAKLKGCVEKGCRKEGLNLKCWHEH